MLRRRQIPDDVGARLTTTVADTQLLTDDERSRFVDDVEWLLGTKHWESARDFDLTDDMRIAIAGQAAVLINGLDRSHYKRVRSIIVHPSTYVSKGERAGPVAGTRSRGPLPVHGLAEDRSGPVLISWRQASRSLQRVGAANNVVFHEFAHKLDMLDGSIDGTPLMPADTLPAWNREATRLHRDLRRRNPHPPLRSYGATNPGEFFAVATEAFFDAPVALLDNEPKLYGLLAEIYNQDPAPRWIERGWAQKSMP